MTHCKDLYDELCSFRNLYRAFVKARKGKRFKSGIGEFELNFEDELFRLQKELVNQTYSPRPLRRFVIRDPKSRVIHASAFRDRLVHHALINILQPIFEPAFIYDSFANQINKGTHKALQRFDNFKKRVSCNGQLIKNARYSNQIIGYILKADIKHYFQTVDHDVLMKIISRRVKDERVLWLIEKILKNNCINSKIWLHGFSYDTDNNNSAKQNCYKGMPLGNLTSQFFANVYLNELDYFVKHDMRTKFYIRHVDDFVILHRSRQHLECCRKQIDWFLRNALDLELHPDKTKIIPIYHGTPFLGFRVYYYHKLLKKSNIRNFMRRIEEFRILHEQRATTKETIDESNEIDAFGVSLCGWMAYAVYGNTYNLRNTIIKKFLYQ